MKNNILFKYILPLCAVLLLHSCNEEDDDFEDNGPVVLIGWQDQTNLRVQPLGSESFTWISTASSWIDEEIELEVTLNTELPITEFAKIDFYVTAEEANGFNFTAPFDTTGKLLTSVDVPESGTFNLTVQSADLYDLFADNFQNDRSAQLALEGDFFNIFWVITNVDGTTLDSREIVVAGGNKYSLPIQVLAVPLTWEGIFDFEILVDSDPFSGLGVGYMGQNEITFDRVEGDVFVYNVSALNFDFGAAFFANYGGELRHNITTGLVSVEFNDGFVSDPRWQISNINGDSLDITWSDDFNTVQFGSWLIARMTRSDGEEWPTNLNTEDSPYLSFPMAGTFDFEVLENPDPFSGLEVGYTSTVTITFSGVNNGVFTYDVSKLNFDYGIPFLANYSGKLDHDTNTGAITVRDALDSDGNPVLNFADPDLSPIMPHWEIRSINGDTMEIRASDDFNSPPPFNGWLGVRLTRTDGEEWPADLNTDPSPHIVE